MSLRRRLFLIFLTYLAIILAGSLFVIWITGERNQEINEQGALIETASLSSADRASLMQSQDRLDDLRTRLTITIAVTLGAALVTTIIAGVLVRRWVTRPIDRVSEAVRSAREGDLGVIAPDGPPEIAELARDVDAMRVSRNRALFDALRAQETIEQSAPIVLSLRSELASDVAELPGDWTAAAELLPAEGVVAGDCYDLIEVSPTMLGLVVVDISGHGAVSGILALRCRELLRAGLRSGFESAAAVQWAANQLDDLGDETFLSCFVVTVDLDTGNAQYASAGHPPAVLCRGTTATELLPTGPIVGPFEGPWSSASFCMEPGDTMAIYTDGLIEARNLERAEFGIERLTALVCEASCDEAQAIAKRCIDEVTHFAPERVHDDVTIVLLCRGPRT